MTATVLVIGGTGLLGSAVVRRLHGDGYRVRVLVRELGAAQRGSDVEYVQGDLDDACSLRHALDGCAAVHVSVRGGPTRADYERVEHRGTARVADLAARAGVSRLTYLSHMLAAPTVSAPDLRAKFHAEQAIRASGVSYTIFRPTYFMDTLPRQIQGGRAVVLGRQPRPFHMIAADDFGRLVSAALTTPASAGACLTVHGPQPLTIPEALQIYCRELTPGTRVVSMPLWFMTILDRTALRGQLRGTLPLMRILQQVGEQGDVNETNRLLGPPLTTLTQWCQQHRTQSR